MALLPRKPHYDQFIMGWSRKSGTLLAPNYMPGELHAIFPAGLISSPSPPLDTLTASLKGAPHPGVIHVPLRRSQLSALRDVRGGGDEARLSLLTGEMGVRLQGRWVQGT